MLGSHVTAMNKAADPANKDKYRSTSVTIGGSGLDWHDVDSYFRPNAVGRYSFDAQKDIVFNKLDKLFDLAITTDCSQCPIHPQLKPIFSDQTARFAQTVRKHGAEPVFFMSWAYQDKPEMTAQLAEAYTSIGNANHALVIPAGLAFARSVEKRIEIIRCAREVVIRANDLRSGKWPGEPEIHVDKLCPVPGCCFVKALNA